MSTHSPALREFRHAKKETAAARDRDDRRLRTLRDCIVRVGGIPVDGVEALQADRAVIALDHVRELEVDRERSAAILRDRFHDLIGAVESKPERNQLLDVRRRLLGGSPLNARQSALVESLPESLRTVIAVVAALDSAVTRARNEAAALYEDGLSSNRRVLRALVAEPAFQKGLLLSSPTLYNNIDRYLRWTADRPSSRDEQIERGLIRYVSRAAMKATPFATFCTVVAGAFEETPHDAPAGRTVFADGDPQAMRTCVRLNKAIYGALWRPLLAVPEVKAAVTVERNPTLEQVDGRWVFLVPANGTEAVRRLPSNEVLDAVLEALDGRSAPLGELSRTIAALPLLDTTVEEAFAYCERLADVGALRLCSPVPDQLPEWDVPLREFLSQVNHAAPQAVATALGALRTTAELFASVSSTTAERERHDLEMRRLIRTAINAVGMDRSRMGKLNPVFEDATAACRVVIPENPGIRACMAALGTLATRLMVLAPNRLEQASMRRVFDTHYADGATVPLLRFFEDYYRDHYKEHLVRRKRLEAGDNSPELQRQVANPFELPFVTGLQTARNRITGMLSARWAAYPDAEELPLHDHDLTAAISTVPHPDRVPVSLSVFCTLLAGRTDEEARVVLKAPMFGTGFGKYFSRFIHLLPDEFYQSVRHQNAAWGRTQLAEIGGDGSFNANLHPPLLPLTIVYPTREGTVEGGQIAITQIGVTRSRGDEHALMLIDRSTGQRVSPVDLGFLTPKARPPLHLLLMAFCPTLGTSLGLPTRPRHGTETSEAPQPVRRIPRFVYEGRVVLGRRQWSMPAEALPSREPGEEAAAFFARVHEWRRALELPTRFYVTAGPPPRSGPEASARQGDNRPAAGPGVDLGATPAEATALEADAQPELDALDDVDDGDGEAESDEEGTPDMDAADAASVPADAPSPAPEAGAPPPATTPSVPTRPARRRAATQKPQYIDLASPVFVGLFSRLGLQPGSTLRLHERLPDGDGLVAHDSGRYAHEWVLQVETHREENPSAYID